MSRSWTGYAWQVRFRALTKSKLLPGMVQAVLSPVLGVLGQL